MVVRAAFLCSIYFMWFTSCTQSESNKDSSQHEQILITRLKPIDKPLPEPMPGDWLYSNNERGQSFDQYKKYKAVKPDDSKKIIYIQPLGTFAPWQDSILVYTISYLQTFFGLETKKLPVLSDLTPVLKGSRAFGNDGRQLLSTTVLNFLHQNMPDDGIVFLAITSEDLYGGPQYNFVFGQARAKHRVAVSSLFRSSDGLIDSLTYKGALERIIKTSAHEIGHMFACQHCIHAICLMNGSNSLGESDARPNRLCSECHQKLQWNLGFDVKQRVEGLRVFFHRHGLERDYLLMNKEMTLITEAEH